MNGQLCYITPVGSGHPDQGLPPGVPGAPDQGLPTPPGIWPPDSLPPLPPGFEPPVGTWPPQRPTVPSHPIVIHPPHPGHRPPLSPGGGHPSQGLPGAPPLPGQGLPIPPVHPGQGLTPLGVLLQDKHAGEWHGK